MTGFGFDPEVPAGYQDADIEQAELEAQAAEIAADRARGVCRHGWFQGGVAAAKARCLECGAIIDDPLAGRL